jgi:hypothetical protein
MEERKVAGVIVDEKTAEAQTRAAMDELMGVDGDSHNIKFEKMYVVRDGVTIEIEVPVDDIDLLDDMDDDDLAEEGERSLGIIDASFDTTLNESAAKKDRNRLAVINVVMNSKEDQPNIVCPYTGSTDVYQIDSSTWASYETDQPFLVRVQMNDEED